MNVSICISAYRRSKQLGVTLQSIQSQAYPSLDIVVVEDGDDGVTKTVCDEFGARYFSRKRRPDVHWSNPAVPNNIAVRQAENDILIIQNAECRHDDPATIEKLIAPVIADPMVATYAAVAALKEDGNFGEWYCHPTESRRPLFFCGAIHKDRIVELGGFEEGFQYYGYEDSDMAERLTRNGVKHTFLTVPVTHQWHPRGDGVASEVAESKLLFEERVRKMDAGELSLVANQGREWGRLDS